MAWFRNFFEKPDWEQNKKPKDGWTTNTKPMSRRYLTPSGMSLDNTEDSGAIDVGVESSAIQAYTYDNKSGDLYITFKGNGKEYKYPNVPIDVVKDLGNAPSKGRFVNQVISQYSENV